MHIFCGFSPIFSENPKTAPHLLFPFQNKTVLAAKRTDPRAACWQIDARFGNLFCHKAHLRVWLMTIKKVRTLRD